MQWTVGNSTTQEVKQGCRFMESALKRLQMRRTLNPDGLDNKSPQSRWVSEGQHWAEPSPSAGNAPFTMWIVVLQSGWCLYHRGIFIMYAEWREFLRLKGASVLSLNQKEYSDIFDLGKITLVMSRGSRCSSPPLSVNPHGAPPERHTSTSFQAWSSLHLGSRPPEFGTTCQRLTASG